MSRASNRFWARVWKCKHPNIVWTGSGVYCGTDRCVGTEEFCPDCRAYLIECGCGNCNGASGWSQARRNAFERKRRAIRERAKA